MTRMFRLAHSFPVLRGEAPILTVDKLPKAFQLRRVGPLHKEGPWLFPIVTPSPSGFFPKQPHITPDPELGFELVRTHKSQQLPIYEQTERQGFSKFTVIRRIKGDVNKLVKNLEGVCNGARIEIKVGSIKIEGHRKKALESYFASLGF